MRLVGPELVASALVALSSIAPAQTTSRVSTSSAGDQGDEASSYPALSADGRFLCFASDRAGGKGGLDLWLFDFQDSTLTHLDLPNSDADERAPSLSNDLNVISFQSTQSGGRGKIDVWNYNRSEARIGQGPEQSSTADDVAPSLRWR